MRNGQGKYWITLPLWTSSQSFINPLLPIYISHPLFTLFSPPPAEWLHQYVRTMILSSRPFRSHILFTEKRKIVIKTNATIPFIRWWWFLKQIKLCNGQCLTTSPCLATSKLDPLGNGTNFDANHVVILFVAKVAHTLCLVDPWIPNNWGIARHHR